MISMILFTAMFLSPIFATFIALLTYQWWLLWFWVIWVLALLDDFLTIKSRK